MIETHKSQRQKPRNKTTEPETKKNKPKPRRQKQQTKEIKPRQRWWQRLQEVVAIEARQRRL